MDWKITAKTATIYKRTIGSYPLPYSFGRLRFRSEDFAIMDVLTGERLLPFADDELEYYYDLSKLESGGILQDLFGKAVIKMDLVAALALKPTHLPKEELINLDAKVLNTEHFKDLNYIVWIYPEGGIECRQMPGWYFIPDHTRYLVNRNTKQVFSTITGDIVSEHLTINGDGYLTCRISSDVAAGTNNGSLLGIHRIVGLTFKNPPIDSDKLIVNHIDHIRTNNDEPNLEWVGQSENVLKANEHWKKIGRERPCKLLNLVTGETVLFDSLDKVAIAHSCARSTVLASLISSSPKQVFKDEWFIFDAHENTEGVDKEAALASRSKSKPKSVLVKDLNTGEVLSYSTANEVLEAYPFLTRKKLYSALIYRSQKQYENIIFKYASNKEDWRI